MRPERSGSSTWSPGQPDGSRCPPPAGTWCAIPSSTCSTPSRSGCCPATVATGRSGRWRYAREYAYEIDAETGQVLRHWSAGREVPAHINSDVCISDSELIFCTGGSQTVVLVDLATMATHRLIEEKPGTDGPQPLLAPSGPDGARQPGSRVGLHQRQPPPQGAAGHRRHRSPTASTRASSLRTNSLPVHRQPRAEPPDRLRPPVARAAPPGADAGAAGVRRTTRLVVGPAARVPPLLPGQSGGRARDLDRRTAVV